MADEFEGDFQSVDPKALSALGTINWLRILPCGHPGQKFKGLRTQPPCATCYDRPEWRAPVITDRMAGALRGSGFASVSASTRASVFDVRVFERISLSTTFHHGGRRTITWVWWEKGGAR